MIFLIISPLNRYFPQVLFEIKNPLKSAFWECMRKVQKAYVRIEFDFRY